MGPHPRLDGVRDPLGFGRLEEQVEDSRRDRRAAEDRGTAPKLVVAGLVRVARRDVGGVGDVDDDRDLRLQAVRRGARARVPELLLCPGDDGDVRSLEPAERLERDVDARAVVEAAGDDTAVRELDRRREQHDRVAGRDE